MRRFLLSLCVAGGLVLALSESAESCCRRRCWFAYGGGPVQDGPKTNTDVDINTTPDPDLPPLPPTAAVGAGMTANASRSFDSIARMNGSVDRMNASAARIERSLERIAQAIAARRQRESGSRLAAADR